MSLTDEFEQREDKTSIPSKRLSELSRSGLKDLASDLYFVKKERENYDPERISEENSFQFY